MIIFFILLSRIIRKSTHKYELWLLTLYVNIGWYMIFFSYVFKFA